MTNNLKVRYDRFSTAVGYGYYVQVLVQAPTVPGVQPGWVTVSTTMYECTFGDKKVFNDSVSIRPETLKAIEKFLGSNNFFGCTKYFNVPVRTQDRIFMSTLAPFEIEDFNH
jgi:Neuraminidase (sialidase)